MPLAKSIDHIDQERLRSIVKAGDSVNPDAARVLFLPQERRGARSMIADILKSIRELLFEKLTPTHQALFALTCLATLLAPTSVTDRLGVTKFTQDNRQWFFLAFLVVGVVFVAGRIEHVRNVKRKVSATEKRKQAILERLHRLTEEEKQILRFYIATKSKTNVLRVDNGVVNGLVAAGIIRMSAPFGDILDGCAYNITELAWEYLNEHHELLMGTTDIYVTHKGAWRHRDY